MIGEKFNRLTVIRRDTGHRDKTRIHWMCKCECGKWVSVATHDLRSGNTKSCGCLRDEKARANMTTHGESKTKLYAVWNTMMSRCYNPKTERYNRYGGRGITVCDEWLHNYQAFRDWANSNGYKEGLTIDRIDVDGNYCPDNCRWVSSLEQQNNTSRNRYITLDGETHTMAEWARKTGISVAAINSRLKSGWGVKETLTTPVRITVK